MADRLSCDIDREPGEEVRMMSSNLGAEEPKPNDSCLPRRCLVSISALFALSILFFRKFLFLS